ncbi:MAG: gliding motility-associated C-terminal domain-containing protein [Imperialibacter sp.]|uniref:T9SS type B sorting domain-containing protein n=1 Tax=Imperialibacter sp. TaxID=2038411 RepID=UPI0032EC253F
MIKRYRIAKFATVLFILLWWLGGGTSLANHIVGGELELVHVQGFRYNLNLIQYFDQAQSANPGPEPGLLAYIYRKSDNAFMRRDTLFLTDRATVPYTNIECSLDELKTLRAFYTREIELLPENFSDSEGYYVVWERCCRNAGIVNIVNSIGAGQTYYLEFPPVVKNGRPFVNSSPSLFPPLSDYACVNQLYYTDFAGVDLDGDSLAYTLVTPLNSSALQALPIPQPTPHPEVIWAQNIDIEHVIPGSPSLRITNKGFITVKPEKIGLYVFSVLCKEFRKGEKIGEVRRDFQMLVVDGCNPEPPPNLKVRVPGSLSFNSVIRDTLVFQAGDNKCFDIQVTDPVGDKNIKMRAVGVNFDGEVEGIFTIKEGYLATSEDILNLQVCLSKCPYVSDGPYLIDLIAADDACPLPQMDTVRLAVIVEPPPNQAPRYVNQTSKIINLTLDEGISYSLPLEGIDLDDETMVLDIVASDFDPEEWGMKVSIDKDEAGSIEAVFEWETGCGSFPFGVKNQFDFTLRLSDNDFCMDNSRDEIQVSLTVNLPVNNPPKLSTTLGSYDLQIPVGTNLSFPVTATDADGDVIDLIAVPVNFSFEDYLINFTPVSGPGEVNTTFSWNLGCDLIDTEVQDYFEVNFVAADNDFCLQTETDVISLKINVFQATNESPVITIAGVENDRVTINSLESIELEVTSTDPDNDFLSIDLLDGVPLPPSETFEFNRVEGQGQAKGFLRWAPECFLFDEARELSYKVSFLSWDTRCPNPKFDTLSIFIDLIDRESPSEFLPANIFTPNGDGINDTYSIPDLPVDNCDDQFQFFRVLTREGTNVYMTRQRDFVWNGDKLPSGVYYYMVKYSQRSFNGVLSIER